MPMFIALRRFTLLCTIVLERFMLKKSHDNATIGAVAVMIGGAAQTMGVVYLFEEGKSIMTSLINV